MNLDGTKFKVIRKQESKNNWVIVFQHFENDLITFAHNVPKDQYDRTKIDSMFELHFTLVEEKK